MDTTENDLLKLLLGKATESVGGGKVNYYRLKLVVCSHGPVWLRGGR